MFKKILLSFIGVLENATKELKRAYEETYEIEDCEALTQNFTEEVNKRKNCNRTKLLQIMTNFVIEKTLEDEDYLMPLDQAVKIAKAMYNNAKLNGKIDELNCYIAE